MSVKVLSALKEAKAIYGTRDIAASPVSAPAAEGWSQRRADGMLALVSAAWGSSYLLMKIGLHGIPPFCLIAFRFGIAFAAVALLFFPRLKQSTGRTLGCGALLGLILFGVFAFLLHGLETTTASSAGFLTGTTVVLVPLFHALLSRKLPEQPVLLGVLLTMAGIGFLTLRQSISFRPGDLLCLCGAAAYAGHILLTDKLTQKEDGLLLGIWQLGFAGMFGLVASVIFEKPALPADASEWLAILGLALVCSAFGFVIQPLAQKYTTPEHTGLLFALEPVFSAVFAFLFLQETLSLKGYIGAALVLGGVFAASAGKAVPERKKS